MLDRGRFRAHVAHIGFTFFVSRIFSYTRPANHRRRGTYTYDRQCVYHNYDAAYQSWFTHASSYAYDPAIVIRGLLHNEKASKLIFWRTFVCHAESLPSSDCNIRIKRRVADLCKLRLWHVIRMTRRNITRTPDILTAVILTPIGARILYFCHL